MRREKSSAKSEDGEAPSVCGTQSEIAVGRSSIRMLKRRGDEIAP